ncbi:alpha/beta fold hydrolase [Lolliginicoccus suaedae]|uniref:alpha/beta fold hydrolase n=1 Tax=Lolliginicoccus suaedae TaxID=2605429 RepID=UPI0011EDF01F|nr:alpha/beta hydrolase [Lolliginicoccus suaedae]
MRIAEVNGVELEYEVSGVKDGEPLLLISPVLADGFRPLLDIPSLSSRYTMINYHRRGWAGSTHTGEPVTIAEHADDARELLAQLGIPAAHVAGHSSGAAVAVELALRAPDKVRSVTLLELSLLSLPCGQEFLQGAGPVLQSYARGDSAGAFAAFMSTVSGLDWAECHALLAERIPGVVEQSVQDADTFFGIELPSLAEWSLSAERAAQLSQPVLSVLGSDTLPLWVEVAGFLRENVHDIQEARISGAGHLLQIQQPEQVAHALSRFLAEHPIQSRERILHTTTS